MVVLAIAQAAILTEKKDGHELPSRLKIHPFSCSLSIVQLVDERILRRRQFQGPSSDQFCQYRQVIAYTLNGFRHRVSITQSFLICAKELLDRKCQNHRTVSISCLSTSIEPDW